MSHTQLGHVNEIKQKIICFVVRYVSGWFVCIQNKKHCLVTNN